MNFSPSNDDSGSHLSHVPLTTAQNSTGTRAILAANKDLVLESLWEPASESAAQTCNVTTSWCFLLGNFQICIESSILPKITKSLRSVWAGCTLYQCCRERVEVWLLTSWESLLHDEGFPPSGFALHFILSISMSIRLIANFIWIQPSTRTNRIFLSM